MNGFMPFNDLMKSLEREELRRELIKEWYLQRSKTFFSKTPQPSRNN